MVTYPQAGRVAWALGVLKWLLAVWALLAGIGAALIIEYSTTLPRVWEVTAILSAVASAGLVWIFLGWFQWMLVLQIRERS